MASSSAKVQMESIGPPQPTAPLKLAVSAPGPPSSTHSAIATRAMVSQFAELQKQNNLSSTSPSVIVENAPLNFVRTGAYNWSDGYIYYAGERGHYWSNSPFNTISAYYFDLYSSLFYPYNFYNKGDGFSVRCITTRISIFQTI